MISLGHSLYVGIGAYTTVYLTMTFGLSPWIGMWAGGVMAGVVGLVIGFFWLPFRPERGLLRLADDRFCGDREIDRPSFKGFWRISGAVHRPSASLLRQLPI